MKLIDILVQELPKRGGWPDGGILAVQDCDKWICFSTLPEVEISGLGEWVNHDGDWVSCIKNCEHLAEDYSKSIITREQYEAALAASKPEWDGEGLPPVGSRVEANYGGEWVEATVAYTERPEGHSDAVACKEALVFDCKTTRPFWADEFRPIRSEADKKRDEAAKGLIEYLDKETDIDNVFSIKDVIGFYDAIAAGKIPHIRID